MNQKGFTPSGAGEFLLGTVLGVRAFMTSRTSKEDTNESWLGEDVTAKVRCEGEGFRWTSNGKERMREIEMTSAA